MGKIEIGHTCPNQQLVELLILQIALNNHISDKLGHIILQIVSLGENLSDLRIYSLLTKYW